MATISYNKRKRGIIKKCIELSTKCGQEVFFVMRDKIKRTMVEFNCTPNFNLEAVIRAKRDQKHYSFTKYFNSDLELMMQNMTPD